MRGPAALIRWLVLACLVGLALPAAVGATAPPRAITLSRGWEVHGVAARPPAPQPPPPEESAPAAAVPATPSLITGRASAGPASWQPVDVPSVFDPRAIASLYPGTVRRYRLRFMGPRTPRGFRWLISFEEVRRAATVRLNGRRLGSNRDPYTPFVLEARGLRPRRVNTLVVTVDSRKDPRVKEGWWNWGGIVRPVHLLPVGGGYYSGIGFMSRVRCRGAASRCRARVVLDGMLERRTRGPLKPQLTVRLRSPRGRVTRRTFRLPAQLSTRRRLTVSMKVPSPVLWSPDRPALYSATVILRDRGRVQQVERRAIGLRSVQVKHGHLYLNNRPLQLRGASIHEDMPGHGAALTRADDARIVADLKALGANVTRAHYLLSERLLSMLDRAGIMVWNEAPIWHRDNLLHTGAQRRRALLTVRRTVKAGRSHPSVVVDSVGNELSRTPDSSPGTRRFLIEAAHFARDLDPTTPVAIDISGRLDMSRQSTYRNFDVIGINQYFGWYPWVSDFSLLEPFLRAARDLYVGRALVMTEFGAETRPDRAEAPISRKGSYAFQAMHAARTLDVVDRLPFLSGAIYWTLREFEIYPGWSGGVANPPGAEPNTRHQKGLITYDGVRKPAWNVVHDHYAATPVYAASGPSR